MHLVQTLAAGVNGAANGTATLLARGTSTAVSYFLDFEATQASAGTVTLDANGGAVIYVNQLVDVRVFDVNGVQLREFVAGDEAPAVEVISRSFTGTSYTDGSSGTNKPTTLQTVLDAWLTSAGSPDFNVSVNGSPLALSLAVAGLSGLFFNVKSYGAIGDGVADDGAAIQAANNAAAATSSVGGIVFFPPGSYRTTTTPSISPGVSLMGCGGTSTKVLVDNPALSSLILFNGVDSGSRLVQGLWFGALSNFNPPLVIVGPLAACVDFVGCIFGGDSFTKGQHLNITATGQGSRVTVTRCTFYQGANQPILTQSSTGRIVCRDSDFIVTLAGAYGQQVVGVTDGVNVHDCRFDASAVTGGTIVYIGFAPASWNGCVFTGNHFKVCPLVIATCLFNSLVTPIFDCFEAGNFWGDTASSVSAGSIVPYGYTTDNFGGFAVFGGPNSHSTRIGMLEAQAGTNGSVLTLNPKAFGASLIRCTAGPGALTVAGNKGRQGERWLLMVTNNSGGNMTITPSADFVLDASAASFTVANNTRQCIEFVWVVNLTATAGVWVQISKPAVT